MVKWNPVTMFSNNNNENQDIEIDNGNRSNNDTALSNNQNREQESTYIGQTSNAPEPQREPANVLPSDFGGYLLHPENRSNQSSDLVHGSDDMVARKDRFENKQNDATSPPDYASKPVLTHDEDISFFGDSNTTEPYSKSRSTLDQAGLHRGSITTLPSAGNQRRGSNQSSGRRESLNNERRGSNHQRSVPISGLGGVHAPESATSTAANVNVPIGGNALPMDKKVSSLPSDKLDSIDDSNQSHGSTDRKSSLSGMASAAVTGAAAVATGAAAALLGSNGQQHFNKTGQTNSKMPSAWPGTPKQSALDTQKSGGYILQNDSTKKDATNCTHDPSMHGQTPCFYTKDNICDEIHDSKPHCEQVYEPSIHGQNPSFYCDKEQDDSDVRNSIKSSAITNNDLTQPESVNYNPANTQGSTDSNFRGFQDSEGIDSNAITGGSSQSGSHDKASAIAIGTASAIGAGAGIAAFNHEPIDAETIRRHSLDNTKEGAQSKGVPKNDLTSSQSDNSQKFGDGYILNNNQAGNFSTDSGLHGVKDSRDIDSNPTTTNDLTKNSGFNQSMKQTAIPAAGLAQPSEKTDLGESALDDGQVTKNATSSNAMSSGPFYKDTDYSSAKAKPNNIADVYRGDAQGTTSNMATPDHPTVDNQENNINNAQATRSNMIVGDNPEPTTASTSSDIGDGYHSSGQRDTQNRITPEDPSVNYKENNTHEVNKTTPRDVTPQYQQTPHESANDSSKSNAVKGAVAGGGIGAALSGLLGLHHKDNTQSGNTESGNTESGNTQSGNAQSGYTRSGNTQSNYYSGSPVHSSASRPTRVDTPDSNDINAMYQTNAKGVHSDQITRENPSFDSPRNNIEDVYHSSAQGVNSDKVFDREHTPTTARYENDIRDVYRTNAEGTTQDMITPGNPTVAYDKNDIRDVYRTTPRNMTPESSTPRYAETPKNGSSHNHNSLLASGGIATAVGGILGIHHQNNDKQKHAESPATNDKSLSNESDVGNNNTQLQTDKDQKALGDTPVDNNTHPQQLHNVNNGAGQALHYDRLPLGPYIDQEPINHNVIDNNSHPQQKHSVGSQVPKDSADDNVGSQVPNDRANDSLHPQTGSAGLAPIFVGGAAGAAGGAGIASAIDSKTRNSNAPGNTESSNVPDNLQESTRDPLQSQTGTENSNVPGNLQESTGKPASDPLYSQTGSTGTAGDTDNSNVPGNLQESAGKPASDPLYSQTRSTGTAGDTDNSNVPGNLQESSRKPASDPLYSQTGSTETTGNIDNPQTGSAGLAPILAGGTVGAAGGAGIASTIASKTRNSNAIGNTESSNVPGNLQESTRDPLRSQIGTENSNVPGNLQKSTGDPASDYPQTGTESSNVPGNLQETPRNSGGNIQDSARDPASDLLHPQTGSTGPAPVTAGSTTGLSNANKAQTTSMADNHNPQSHGSVGAAPIIAGATGVPVPGNMGSSKGSFSSTRAITDNIIPSANGARIDEVKDRTLERQNQINTTGEPKRKTSLTEGIKSAFRRLSLRSDKKTPKDGRRLSAAEAFKNQALTHNGKSNSAPDATAGATGAGSTGAGIAGAGIAGAGIAGAGIAGTSTADSSVPNHQVQQQQQQPAGGYIVNNNEVTNAENKSNEEANKPEPSKKKLSAGKSEHRRGSIQNVIGKIIGNQNMQDKGILSQVSGKEKINAYNAQSPTNLNNL